MADAEPTVSCCDGRGVVGEERKSINVLGFSTLFPNDAQPRHGIFLRHRLANLAAHQGIRLRVVAPIPWFPSSHPMFGRYGAYRRAPAQAEQCGFVVQHPRYLVLPKVGMTLAPLLMAIAVLPKLMAIRARGFDFDVIDAYYLYPDGVVAALLGQILNRPVILTAFGNDVSLLPRFGAVRAQILWAVGRAASVTAVCKALKQGLVDIGASADKVHVIPHGVDLTLFRPP